MKIVEFRVPLPITLDDYQRCCIFLVIEASLKEMESGNGFEVFKNEDYYDGDKVGRYTEKRFHLAKNLPTWLRSILGDKLTILTEKSWNMYPSSLTKYYNEALSSIEFSIQTENHSGLDINDNVMELTPNELKKRTVIFIDITKFNKYKMYDPIFDVTKFHSDNHPQFPLNNDWFNDKQSSGIITYKLIRLNLPYFGLLASKIENYVINILQEKLVLYLSSAMCWIDQWYHLSFDYLRESEINCYDKLNAKFYETYNIARKEQYDDVIPPYKTNTINTSPTEGHTSIPITSPPEVTTTSDPTRRGASTLEVQSNSVPLAVEASSNSLPVNGNATPGDRGEGVDGMRNSTRPQVEPVADLREAEGQLNREADGRNVTLSGEAVCKTTSDGMASGMINSTGPQVENLPQDRERTSSITSSARSLVEDVVVGVKVTGDDVTPTSLELSGPVIVPNVDDDDDEFKDALESLDDLLLYESIEGSLSIDSVSDVKTNKDDDLTVKTTRAKQILLGKEVKSNDIPITFTGYLLKLGKGFSSWNWNLRYIIICGVNLYYFNYKNDIKPKDVINLKNSRINWVGSYMNRQFVFSITTHNKITYYWSADAQESVKRWILLLQVLCEETPTSIINQLASEWNYHQNDIDIKQ